MVDHIGKAVFRVVGCLSPGYLKLAYVRDPDGLLVTKKEDGSMIIHIKDDVWIDEVPLELVPQQSRIPNSLITVSVRNRTQVVSVEPANEEEA
jgi:hypothetical protein